MRARRPLLIGTCLKIRVKIEFDPTSDWVAELASVLGRYAGHEEAKMVLTARLVEWGLLNVVPSPDNPNQFHLDTRPLQQLLSTHGPRVSTVFQLCWSFRDQGRHLDARDGGRWIGIGDLDARLRRR